MADADKPAADAGCKCKTEGGECKCGADCKCGGMDDQNDRYRPMLIIFMKMLAARRKMPLPVSARLRAVIASAVRTASAEVCFTDDP